MSRRAHRAPLWAVTVLALLVPLVAVPAAQAGTTPDEPFEVVNVTRPQVTGTPAYGEVVAADPGDWEPADAELAYRWLVDGDPVRDADRRRFRPRLKDIGHRLSVEVTATATDPETGEVVSAQERSERVRVVRGTFESRERPTIDGARRYDHTLVVRPGTWTRRPDRVRVQWLRDGRPVKGATGPRHHLGLDDFGKRISVRLTARKEGFRAATAVSRRTVRIMHRVPVRHTVTYRVETRGKIVADLATFRQQAQQTFDDPRGWRGSGVAFRRVTRGGAFVLVLSEASQVPTFSSGCSAQWSCRVGNYVVINQLRWLHASPMWRQQKRSLRDYRHMVVNHETGHWLGHGHRYCPASGALAPVMQQQSKGLAGCRPNPWPTAAERRVPRFG